jgi:hypothetical protein
VRVIAEIERVENEAAQKSKDSQLGAGMTFEKCTELECEFLKHLDSVSIDDICQSHQNKNSLSSETSVDFNI